MPVATSRKSLPTNLISSRPQGSNNTNALSKYWSLGLIWKSKLKITKRIIDQQAKFWQRIGIGKKVNECNGLRALKTIFRSN